jgi:hypothetical protein
MLAHGKKGAKKKRAAKPARALPGEAVAQEQAFGGGGTKAGWGAGDTEETGEKWYEEADAAELAPIKQKGSVKRRVPSEAMDKMRERAELLLQNMADNDAQAKKKSRGNSDQRFLRTVLKSGTLSDRISAMTLMVSEAPLYQMSVLKNIVQMCNKNNRRESGMAVEAAKDLFIYNLLPPGRKLKAFSDQPLHLVLTDGDGTASNNEKDAQLVSFLPSWTFLTVAIHLQ